MKEDLRRPFEAGEWVLLVEPRGRRYMFRLRPGQKFDHQHLGHVLHDAVLGRPPGIRLQSTNGTTVACVRPALEDYILKKLPRRTQIIYPKDVAAILVHGDLFPGARVLEAGIGSGALAMYLLRFLGPGGELISYERREEFAERARGTLEEIRRTLGDSGAEHRVVLADVYDGIAETNLDVVILDVPEPWRAADHAAAALRAGGTLISWLPTTLQVYELVRGLQEDLRWTRVNAVEVLERFWDVGPQSVRPAHRMVGHTGFLITARRVLPGEDPGATRPAPPTASEG